MSKKEKNKFYVVWKGVKPGVYSSWAECRKYVEGFPGAKYMGFPTQGSANEAYRKGPESFWGSKAAKDPMIRAVTRPEDRIIGTPQMNSISVDAAWNTNTLVMEYQGVRTDTREVLFREGPFRDGTNNVGEFLAIVHALAMLKRQNSTLPVYSDSRNAIGWVKSKQHRSKLQRTHRNAKLFDLLDRAGKWLKENKYPNKILKWETKAWGENPADFGRK